MIVYIDVLMLR